MENLSNNSNNGDIPLKVPEVIPADQDPDVIRELSRFSVTHTVELKKQAIFPSGHTSFVKIIGGE